MMFNMYCSFVFFFKQKTAYEMRISDWSSDVCSSDLLFAALAIWMYYTIAHVPGGQPIGALERVAAKAAQDRQSVVSGKSVSVRVDLGGRRIIKKKKQIKIYVLYLHHNIHN